MVILDKNFSISSYDAVNSSVKFLQLIQGPWCKPPAKQIIQGSLRDRHYSINIGSDMKTPAK